MKFNEISWSSQLLKANGTTLFSLVYDPCQMEETELYPSIEVVFPTVYLLTAGFELVHGLF